MTRLQQALEWILKDRIESIGPMKEWDTETKDAYHRDVGFIYNMFTELWPTECKEDK